MAAKKLLMWGVLVCDSETVGAEEEVGHCCLTSFEVERPREGELYAGL
jgi:hypothetical protein